jgi:hypothetical protein
VSNKREHITQEFGHDPTTVNLARIADALERIAAILERPAPTVVEYNYGGFPDGTVLGGAEEPR